MNITTRILRQGYDGKRCLVHARMCASPEKMLATAQYLDVTGSDLFSGIQMSQSADGGRSWGAFIPQEGLAPRRQPDGTILTGCDATPLYHKKTGRILLLGHTAVYRPDSTSPLPADDVGRNTFYSVLEGNAFRPMELLPMPAGYENCGNGSGQSLELDSGELLIPVYFSKTLPSCSQAGQDGRAPSFYACAVMRCAFDGDQLSLLSVGNALTMESGRGLYEPSLVCWGGYYWMTMRSDGEGYFARSTDGLHYGPPQVWRWDDGSILPTYNTQQHWMVCADALYLVYTRRGAGNDHVFRHRAPLFTARVEKLRLVRSSEQVVVPERGARLGNFGVCPLPDGRAAVMAAEWMQPAGCERYGSNNAVYLSFVQA